MAIRRCPYCKAIIDEQDKYCNNCGTQLLFPEDEFVEEDIPGDKIIEEEEESQESDKEEKGEGEEEKEEKEEEMEDEEKLDSSEEEEETDELEGLAEAEEEEAGEAGKEERELQAWIELQEEMARKVEREGQKIQPREFQADIEEETAEKVGVERIHEADKKYEVSIEEDELVFKTKDLEKLTQTVEEGKKELEEFLGTFEEKREEEGKPVSDTKGDFPPWVSGIKEAPSSVTPHQEEEAKEEQRPMRQEWAADSGIGIPEKVPQTTLPFTDKVAREEKREKERGEELVKETVEEAETQHPTGFSLKLKAKCVDLIFITALWVISLWFTAGVIGVSFFKIIFRSPLPVFAFYLILLLLYFFLFLYFLGETLGDHYFSEEE